MNAVNQGKYLRATPFNLLTSKPSPRPDLDSINCTTWTTNKKGCKVPPRGSFISTGRCGLFGESGYEQDVMLEFFCPNDKSDPASTGQYFLVSPSVQKGDICKPFNTRLKQQANEDDKAAAQVNAPTVVQTKCTLHNNPGCMICASLPPSRRVIFNSAPPLSLSNSPPPPPPSNAPPPPLPPSQMPESNSSICGRCGKRYASVEKQVKHNAKCQEDGSWLSKAQGNNNNN